MIPRRKSTIPKAIREQVWLRRQGRHFEAKCSTKWCTNMITAFDFHCGHDIPASKGGTLDLDNLWPLCNRCNTSMGNDYTLSQWNALTTDRKWNCCSASVAVEPSLK